MATQATSTKTNRWRQLTWRAGIGLAVTAVVLSTIAALPAGAQSSGCGTYSFSFEGTRLLNDGISNSAGPYGADLPPGTYTVTLLAHDYHSTQPDPASQTAEQYHVVLDSGYVSPPSHDIPDDADTTTSVFTGQIIGQSNAISVTHVGVPGINSVNPICVGFTPEPSNTVPEASPLPETPRPKTPADSVDDPAEADKVVEVEVNGIVEERADADREPAGPDAAPRDPIDATPAPPEVAEVPPIQDIGEPVGVIRNPSAPETAPGEKTNAEVPTAQVAGITLVQDAPVAQAPLLAITGPTTNSFLLSGFAFLLLAIGGFLLRHERRLAEQR